jgi:polysaccharide pyruvyl transferase WcaK-like protein
VARVNSRRRDRAAQPRVGLFGLLGDGNIGNDASMEAVLEYLRVEHPGAIVDAMCPGPAHIAREYGIDAVSLYWRPKRADRLPRLVALTLMAVTRLVDAARIAAWVRRHEVVLVPGMGVLEASLPLRPWELPYAMFWLCASGRLFRTKVALVSVGATMINQRVTRWLLNSAARLAYYRTYRDDRSLDAMTRRGVDTTHDKVYPDLVFGIAAPAYEPGDPRTVGIGVMTYYGTNDDRAQAADVHAAYVASMQSFVRWLVGSGRRVRLLVGDRADDLVVQEILADVQAHWPDIDPGVVVAEPVASLADLIKAMIPVATIVATRFHNVMCALKLTKPVVSLGYAPKNLALMAEMGLSDYCQNASNIDVELLIQQFTDIEARWCQLRPAIMERNAANIELQHRQFAELSAKLFGPANNGPLLRELAKSARPD